MKNAPTTKSHESALKDMIILTLANGLVQRIFFALTMLGGAAL